MSFGYGPKLPISFDDTDGIALTKTLKEVAQQNFKNLVLTNPGERIMDSNFGVGIYSLFETFSEETKAAISSRLNKQVKAYLSYITIKKVDFEQNDIYPNGLLVRISYFIEPLGVRDTLEIK